jgi:hypothetical protein
MADLELKMNAAGVDPNLISWLQAAARNSPFRVVAYSGMRQGDPRFHGQGKAIDINLIDPASGKTIPNYQNAASFKVYQDFANQVRAAQMQMNPEAGNLLRWGGYFSGPKGKYGAMDLMHFDVGGGSVPMGGGGWETGLSQGQASLWNLSPGGASGVSGSPLVSTMASATNPDPNAFLDDNKYKPFTSMKPPSGAEGAFGTQEQMNVSPPAPGVSLETQTAVPPPGVLDNPGGDVRQGANPAAQMSDLASVFKVKDIGEPAQTTPYALPQRRKWT